MKFGFLVLICVSFFGCSSKQIVETSLAKNCSTKVNVVELKDYSFTGTSFLEERPDLSFNEVPANAKFQNWAQDAISKTNKLFPPETHLCDVKIKLIFDARIKSPKGKTEIVPISIIESYQEPKTESIRLGMLELKDDEVSFKDTVAHEYSHLVFESISRKSGTTGAGDENIKFWPKSVYEGAADYMASLAMNSTKLGSSKNWSARDINQYATVEEAMGAKDEMISKAKVSFKKEGLVPRYHLYNDWLKKVDHFIKASGGKDPYAEGTWLAGNLRKASATTEKRDKIINSLVIRARSGQSFSDAKEFYITIVENL